jgi:divalent metal cation (Fe/Co/Zn/Cd) transporter
MTGGAGTLERADLIGRAFRLEWLTVGWLLIEAAGGVAAGIAAHSLTLIAFGADSVIELASACLLIWRLNVEMKRGAEFPEILERRTARLASVLLFALAVYLAGAAAWGLSTRSAQQFSVAGAILAGAAIPIMVALAKAKADIARRIASRALRADAAEAIACAYLSGVVVAGLLAQGLTGAWWVDSVTSLALIPFLVREALEAWRNDDD